MSDGHGLYYEVHGEGDPPLLVHPGLLSSVAGGMPHPAGEERRTVAYDAIGTASSSRPSASERSFDSPRQIADAFELLDHLGIECAVAAGWARGAAHAVRHALARPDATAAVVIAGPPLVAERIDARPSEVASAFATLARSGASAVSAFVEIGMPDASAETKRAVRESLEGTVEPDVLAAQMSHDRGALSLEEAARVRCPVLLVAGTGDIIVPPDHARELAAAFPDCRLVEIDGAANGLLFTRTAEVQRAVLEFLA